MDINSITLLDLIDRRTLQSLQDAFSDATGMAALATDDSGSVTELSNPTDFCMKYTRRSRVGCERCNQCDLQGGAEASRTGRPSVYYCHGGLVDFAAPILVGGKHIGSLIGGQVLTEKPDENKFRKIAKEIGVNPDEYIAALRKVKVVPKSQVDAAANLLYQMANALSEVGYQRLAVSADADASTASIASFNMKIREIEEKMQVISKGVETIVENVDGIKEAAQISGRSVDNTDSIVKAIESASTQLTLIGFNASIEAKRAGAAGAGFNVIAQEVRTLADKNTKQAGEVEETLNEIKKSMAGINAQIKAVHAQLAQTTKVFDELKTLIDETGNIVGN